MTSASEGPIQVVSTHQIRRQIENLISTARKEIILVSPFNEHWDNLENEIKKAARRRSLRVTIYYRRKFRGKYLPNPAENYRNVAGVPIDNLHAKIYANEGAALITSLNLTWWAAFNSREVGLLIRDGTLLREINAYVETLSGDGEESWDDGDEREEDYLEEEETGGKIHVLESEWHYDDGPQRKTYTSCGRRVRKGWRIVDDGREWNKMLRKREIRPQLCKTCIGPGR